MSDRSSVAAESGDLRILTSKICLPSANSSTQKLCASFRTLKPLERHVFLERGSDMDERRPGEVLEPLFFHN